MRQCVQPFPVKDRDGIRADEGQDAQLPEPGKRPADGLQRQPQIVADFLARQMQFERIGVDLPRRIEFADLNHEVRHPLGRYQLPHYRQVLARTLELARCIVGQRASHIHMARDKRIEFALVEGAGFNLGQRFAAEQVPSPVLGITTQIARRANADDLSPAVIQHP